MRNSENTTKFICIVDYNLTRISDVQCLTSYAKQKYNLKSILFRENPNEKDFEIADRVINLNPRGPQFAEKALESLGPDKSSVLAVVPFSDNSVVGGSKLAELLCLKADSSILAERAYSKWAYRQGENRYSQMKKYESVFYPLSCKVDSLDDLINFAQEVDSLILKPTSEGNNRGVIRLQKEDDLAKAFKEIEHYSKDGIIAEELIPFDQEFSVDGIGNLNFCTQKMSSSGRYPVECGQIVPAMAHSKTIESLINTSKMANEIVGQKIGPFHNEIKYDHISLKSAVVEPNRRPAGMRIWHLAERAFNINFFHLWVDQLIVGLSTDLSIVAQKRVGIRMLSTAKAGVLRINQKDNKKINRIIDKINSLVIKDLSQPFSTFNFQWNLLEGVTVEGQPKDNSQFLAQICFETNDLLIDLELLMNKWSDLWDLEISQYIIPLSNSNVLLEDI